MAKRRARRHSGRGCKSPALLDVLARYRSEAVFARDATMRDYFAGQAMTALLAQMTRGNQGQICAMYDPNDPAQARTLAFLSYQAADAMLEERKK
jgi:hypothetical protein